MPEIEPNRVYTLEQARELLQYSRATMSRLLASGRLQGVKPGKDWRILGRHILAFMESGRTPYTVTRATRKEDSEGDNTTT